MTLLRIFATFLLLAASALASTTTLTGTIKDPQGNGINGFLLMQLPVPAQDQTTNVLVSNSPVYFRLVNGAVTGGAPLFDVANLQPAGLYYSARAYDQAGNLIFNGNYVVTGATFTIGAAVPTNITTANISYAGVAFLGINNVGTLAFTNAGIFTNAQVNPNVSVLLNGANLGTEWGYAQGVGFDSEAYSAAIIVPSNATAHQITGYAGYVDSFCNSSGGNTCNAVGLYGAAYAHANGANPYGGNFLVQDFGGVSNSRLFAVETDVNINGTPQMVAFYLNNGGTLVGTVPSGGATPGNNTCPGSGSYGWLFCPPWPVANGIVFMRNSVNPTAIQIDATGNSGAASSAAVAECGNDGTNAHCSTLQASSNGDQLILPAAGRAAEIISGVPTLSIAAPTVSSGFNAGAITNHAGPSSIAVTVGTGTAGSTGVLGLPTSTNGWNCWGNDATTPATNLVRQSGSTVSTATLTNYNTSGTATNWTNGDVILITCFPR